jgi:hypothetical protein
MRVVQSANIESARGWPSWAIAPLICPPAWPERTRRAHASAWLLNVPSAAGISRVPLVPSWWQAVQPPDLSERIHCAWVFTLGSMPFPCGPVPGNSDFSGTLSSESHQPAG